eukprot:XP_020398487.1 atherin-like [Zea mays]
MFLCSFLCHAVPHLITAARRAADPRHARPPLSRAPPPPPTVLAAAQPRVARRRLLRRRHTPRDPPPPPHVAAHVAPHVVAPCRLPTADVEPHATSPRRAPCCRASAQLRAVATSSQPAPNSEQPSPRPTLLPTVVEYHLPHKVARQFGLRQEFPVEPFSTSIELHKFNRQRQKKVMDFETHHLGPSTAGLSSSRSTRHTFEDVAHEDEDDEHDDDTSAGAAGQEEIGPSQL